MQMTPPPTPVRKICFTSHHANQKYVWPPPLPLPSQVPNKRLVHRFHKLPYLAWQGPDIIESESMRKELGVTGLRYGHKIFECTVKQVPRLMESWHNGHWTKYILQQAENRASSVPPQKKYKSVFHWLQLIQWRFVIGRLYQLNRLSVPLVVFRWQALHHPHQYLFP